MYGRPDAVEALSVVTRFCFGRTELQRLCADADVREGVICQGKMVGTWCNYNIYGLLRNDVVG